jgi:alkanesulfonate monooxygenase SsuD/methylene tetrahydromethanopterin reductase-like flavin-dependent oxidoreductase (luciferase family)
LRRAARLADGWMGAGGSTTDDFVRQVSVLRAALSEIGRDPSTFQISKRAYVAVDDDRARALRRFEDWFHGRGHDPEMASRVCVVGPAAAVAAQLEEVIRAGARLLLLNPVFDWEAQLEILAGELIPRLREVAPGTD